MPVTWIVDADSSYARIFARNHRGKQLEEIIDLTNPGARLKPGELESGKPGGSFDSAGKGRHAMTPRHTRKQVKTSQFVNLINDYLANHESEFDKLILISPPGFLGSLRKSLDENVSRKVAREIRKETVRLNMQKIRELL